MNAVPYQPTPSNSAPMPTISALSGVSNARATAVILAASAAVFGFLCWLLYVKQAAGVQSPVIRALPAVNAAFNSISTVLLSAGFVAIMRRRFTLHMRLMFAALCSSACFLIGYVVYHNAHGDTKFINPGGVRYAYFAILISHVTLSAVAVPLILSSFFLSLSGKYPLHKRVSRFTFPIWLYVSVTGVVVFAMLKLYNHA
jgi:putative membrane protein